LAISEPVAGNHNDLYDIEVQFEVVITTLQEARIPIEGLFLNADAGFDSKDFRKSCGKKDINANVCFNKRNGNSHRDEYFDKELYSQRYAVEHTNADEVYEKMNRRLTNFSTYWIKTITFDNGKEFAYHYKIAKDLNVKTYFTRPYTSQDKGTVENRIGVIRRFSPKKTYLRNITDQKIKEVERLLNYRPIRKFNYNNPIEVLNNKIVALMG
jgi:IS30 family transposase